MRVAAVLLVLGVGLPAAGVNAQVADAWGFGWVADMSIDFGGEAVAELQFANGDRQKLTTGDGFSLSGGFEVHPRAQPRLGLRTLVGWKLSTSAAENADIWFSRVPVEVIGMYQLHPDWHLGAGLAYHIRPKLDLDLLGPEIAFDNAAGALLELAWRKLALTYTAMNYRAENGSDFGANAIGVSVSYVFGKR